MSAEKHLTIPEAAERLQVKEKVIKSAIANGALSHVRLGKEIRIHPQDLDDFCRRHTVKAWTAPAQHAA